jgi:hypothetical protein
MTRRLVLLLFALVFSVCVWVATTLAQSGSTNAITISSATPQSGQVTVNGTYTVDTNDGFTLVGILVDARPSGGVAGEGAETSAMAGSGNFFATVSVPAGQFDIQAILEVNDSAGTTHYFCSNVQTVTVSQ